MKSISSTTKLFLVLSLLAAIISVGGFCIFFNDLKTRNEHISILTNTIEAQLQKENSKESTQNIIKNTKSEREQIANYFVGKDTIAEFIESLETLAGARGINFVVDSVAVEEVKNEAMYEQLKMKVTVVGDWKSVATYVSLIEHLPYKLTISSVVFTKLEQSDDPKVKKKDAWRVIMEIGVIKLK
jgi:Tfp pilus assembly protein PilO